MYIDTTGSVMRRCMVSCNHGACYKNMAINRRLLLWTSSRRTPSELTGTGSLYIYISAVCLSCKKHVPVTVFFCFPLFSCQSAQVKPEWLHYQQAVCFVRLLR